MVCCLGRASYDARLGQSVNPKLSRYFAQVVHIAHSRQLHFQPLRVRRVVRVWNEECRFAWLLTAQNQSLTRSRDIL